MRAGCLLPPSPAGYHGGWDTKEFGYPRYSATGGFQLKFGSAKRVSHVSSHGERGNYSGTDREKDEQQRAQPRNSAFCTGKLRLSL